MTALPIAFYAPMKSPDHPTPSGDRTVARLLLRALQAAGFAPELASELRSYEPAGDASRQAALRDQGLAEADRLGRRLSAMTAASRPRIWFTYHSYYKAPDWLGPAVSAHLGIPYALAEATRADKRASGPWALAHAGAEAALRSASCVFVLTGRDREALERRRPSGQALVRLPPFLDLAAWGHDAAEPPAPAIVAPARLLSVAMMRDGDKLRSYGLLADALRRIGDRAWTLDIVGDGPARPEVERLFDFAQSRVAFHGRLDAGPGLRALYRAASLFVWPAVNEAYGMALLEAQAQGCPVLAGREGGVADALVDGATGRLAPPRDAGAFAAALAALLDRPEQLAAMRPAAWDFVRRERGLDGAAAILAAALLPLAAREVAA